MCHSKVPHTVTHTLTHSLSSSTILSEVPKFNDFYVTLIDKCKTYGQNLSSHRELRIVMCFLWCEMWKCVVLFQSLRKQFSLKILTNPLVTKTYRLSIILVNFTQLMFSGEKKFTFHENLMKFQAQFLGMTQENLIFK
jgi:hypothetical protein